MYALSSFPANERHIVKVIKIHLQEWSALDVFVERSRDWLCSDWREIVGALRDAGVRAHFSRDYMLV